MAEEIKVEETLVEETSTEVSKEITTDFENEIKKLKAQLSRANTEAAENKRKYVATLDEKEKAELERAEAENKLKEELDGYRTKERISNYTSKLLANGYDEDTAVKMAQSLPEGIPETFFAAQKAFIEERLAAYKAELLSSNQPPISVGDPISNNESMTQEEFDNLGYSARAKLKTDNPELYEKLNKK